MNSSIWSGEGGQKQHAALGLGLSGPGLSLPLNLVLLLATPLVLSLMSKFMAQFANRAQWLVLKRSPLFLPGSSSVAVQAAALGPGRPPLASWDTDCQLRTSPQVPTLDGGWGWQSAWRHVGGPAEDRPWELAAFPPEDSFQQ